MQHHQLVPGVLHSSGETVRDNYRETWAGLCLTVPCTCMLVLPEVMHKMGNQGLESALALTKEHMTDSVSIHYTRS